MAKLTLSTHKKCFYEINKLVWCLFSQQPASHPTNSWVKNGEDRRPNYIIQKLVDVLTISNLSVTDLSSGGPSLKFTHTETDPDSRIYLIIFKNIYWTPCDRMLWIWIPKPEKIKFGVLVARKEKNLMIHTWRAVPLWCPVVRTR